MKKPPSFGRMLEFRPAESKQSTDLQRSYRDPAQAQEENCECLPAL